MVRALVIDDSALFRRLIKDMLEADGTIEVVGTAADPFSARRQIKALDPDVLTLDVEMARMDGITFLRNLMRLRPMPVVMVSSYTSRGADVTLEALALGAIDFITKPSEGERRDFWSLGPALRAKVIAAAASNPRAIDQRKSSDKQAAPRSPQRAAAHIQTQLIAFGASTGGTEALAAVFADLPSEMPGIVIAQHLPAAFTGPFADRLSKGSRLDVVEASDGEPIEPGRAYLAPGGVNLSVARKGQGYRCRLDSAAACHQLRPSVDVLFQSVAESAGDDAIGIILTGMGRDGADGLLALRQRGAYTIAQDEASSVVWGMPGAAVRRDAALSVLAKSQIAAAIVAQVAQGQSDPRQSRLGD